MDCVIETWFVCIFFEILLFVVIVDGGHMVESFACVSCVCAMTHTVS